MKRRWTANAIVMLAVLTALTTVLTVVPKIPVPGTQGYVSLADVGVYFAAFVFGPVFGLIAGGVGTGLADVLGGFGMFAPASLIIHGLQGLLAGYLGYRAHRSRQIAAWLAGAVIMFGGYFLAEITVYQYGMGAALTELPYNIAQSLLGGIIALPLAAAIRRAWPPIDTLGRPRTWEER